MPKIRRNLWSYEQVKDFLYSLCDGEDWLQSEPSVLETAMVIGDLERLDDIHRVENTFDSHYFRVTSTTPAKREVLWRKIVRDLTTLPRVDDDSQISLGTGGILPPHNAQHDRHALIVIGPPASGKSTIARCIADHFGAAVLDADFAKPKLPEFRAGNGASLVHRESDVLVFGPSALIRDVKPALASCVESGINLVIPKVGRTAKGFASLRDMLTSVDPKYRCSLVLVNVGKETAARRAIQRWKKTGRYVSLSYIVDQVEESPRMWYYRALSNDPDKGKWESYAEYDAEQWPTTCVACSENWPKSALDQAIDGRYRIYEEKADLSAGPDEQATPAGSK